MLLVSPRSDRQQRRASLPPLLLSGVLLCVLFADVCVGFQVHPTGNHCLLDCARVGRQFCKPGSAHCGPCLAPLEEDKDRHCVRKRHHPHGKKIFNPDPEEEIDFLHSVIEKKVSEFKPAKASKQRVSLSQTDVKSESGVQIQRSGVLPSSPVVLPTTPTPQPGATAGVENRLGPGAFPAPGNDSVIVIVISLCIIVGLVAVILSAFCFVRLRKESRLAQKVDYPAFGDGGKLPATANGTSMGDTKLAHNAQMFHYLHQKQQMLSMGKHQPEQKAHHSEVTSDEEEVGGDFTVYECPGLAPTGEMEVKNPLFDDSTLHYQGNHK